MVYTPHGTGRHHPDGGPQAGFTRREFGADLHSTIPPAAVGRVARRQSCGTIRQVRRRFVPSRFYVQHTILHMSVLLVSVELPLPVMLVVHPRVAVGLEGPLAWIRRTVLIKRIDKNALPGLARVLVEAVELAARAPRPLPRGIFRDLYGSIAQIIKNLDGRGRLPQQLLVGRAHDNHFLCG